MQITYCDFCMAPLKEHDYYMMYVTTPVGDSTSEIKDYNDYMEKISREVKQICPGCKDIFDKMFELKLKKLSELAEEIDGIYKLPSKKNPKERKNEKEK